MQRMVLLLCSNSTICYSCQYERKYSSDDHGPTTPVLCTRNPIWKFWASGTGYKKKKEKFTSQLLIKGTLCASNESALDWATLLPKWSQELVNASHDIRVSHPLVSPCHQKRKRVAQSGSRRSAERASKKPHAVTVAKMTDG